MMDLNLQDDSLYQLNVMCHNNGWDSFQLNKVYLCEKTNAIRVRYKHPWIGIISGVVRPNFSLLHLEDIDDIIENITVDKVKVAPVIIKLLELKYQTEEIA